VLVAAFGVLMFAATASPASAKETGAPCWRQIQDEWVDNRQISTTHPLHCYREAIAHVPEDLLVYTDIEQDILAARQLASRQRSLTGAQPRPPSTGETQRDPDQSLFAQGFDTLGPENADSMPLPILILGGLSLLLIAAGAAGLITRRVRAGRVQA
jgi:hypothetical protein